MHLLGFIMLLTCVCHLDVHRLEMSKLVSNYPVIKAGCDMFSISPHHSHFDVRVAGLFLRPPLTFDGRTVLS